MNTRLQGALRVSVEAFDDAPLAPTQLPSEQEEAVAVAELQHAEQAVENTDQQLETLEQVSQSLEALAVALESNPNGLEYTSAQMLHITVEGQLARIGANTKVLPALECFQPQSSQMATTLSMEGLKEAAKELFLRIKDMLLKLGRSIREYMKRVSGSVAQMKRTAEALAKRMDSLRPKNTSQVELPESVANELRIDGRVPPGLTGLKITLGVLEDMETFATGLREQMAQAGKVMAAMGTVRGSADLARAVAPMKGFRTPVPRAFRHNGDDGYLFTDTICGDTRFTTKRPTDFSDADDAVSIMRQFNASTRVDAVFGSTDATRAFTTSVTVPALTKAEVAELNHLMPLVEKICQQAYNEAYQDSEDLGVWSVAMANHANLAIAEQITPEEDKEMKSFIMGLSRVHKNHAMVVHRVASETIHVMRAYLRWAKLSADAIEAQQVA